ncbi:hypothetical protein G7Y79_00068g096180 [Physcia stellaris]|nr:hypothetical protein G7Y79_00068g096180 [Physcia stellaris]
MEQRSRVVQVIGTGGATGSGTSSSQLSNTPAGISGPGTGVSSLVVSSVLASVSSVRKSSVSSSTGLLPSTVASASSPTVTGTDSTAVPGPSANPTTAPVTTSSGESPLIVVTTSYDAEASSSTSIDPKITSNTAVTTSDDSHPPGVYPVIKGGPSCFFCPPGLDLGGLVLWGMKDPGIYPPPIPPPFPKFPTMTIGNDIVPTPKPEDDEPQSTQGEETTSNAPTSTPASSPASTTSQSASTSSAKSSAPVVMCGASCSACVGDDSSSAASTGVAKRVLANPQNGDVSGFVISRTSPELGARGMQVPLRTGGPRGGLSSALARQLGNQAFEMPSVQEGGPTDPTSPDFATDIINNLDAGDGSDQMPGIRQYTGAGWQFSLGEDPVTFIVTPRSRIDPRPGNYLYGPEVAQIKTKLRQLIPGSEPRIFDYETKHRAEDQQNTATGKVLFQYDPVQAFLSDPDDTGCPTKQAAAVQLWLEDNPEPLYRDIWFAEPNQQVAQHRKRDIAAAACLLSQYKSTIAPTVAASTVATVGGLSSLPPSVVSGKPTLSFTATNPMISSTIATTTAPQTSIISPTTSILPNSPTSPTTISTSPPATQPSTSAPPPTTSSPPSPTTTTPEPSPTVAPVDPANTDSPDCFPIPEGHIFDTHESAVKQATKYFAANYAQTIIAASDGPVNVTQYLNHGLSDNPFDNNDLGDDQFLASILSVDECHSDYNLGEPLTGLKCEDIMYHCWKSCTGNKGRGGSITAGCLKYSFGTYSSD